MAPAANTSGMECEVFLSFRGPDTRNNFTSCLYHDMVEKGIRVFKDDEELRISQQIGGNLLRALDDTQIYIPIFSKGFASSVWCLREVAHMVDCTSKSDGKKEILPIFFDVEPDDVKLKTNLYRDALFEHEKKYSSREVKGWEDALVEVPTRVGWKLEGEGYGELIKLIVREVLLKLKVKNRPLPDHLVETDDLKHLEKLLDVDSDDHVRFVILHGMGGIDMQKKLLSETLGSNSAQEIYDTNGGIDHIMGGLGKKKVLLVVDNVVEKKQLENLAGSWDWFGCGSRIIVTVRDIRTIRNEDNQMQPSHYMEYLVKEMPLHLAIQLFSKHAFRDGIPPETYYKFSNEVVSSIGRLPLTLEVVGSLFANTVRSKWDETLEDLKQVPSSDVRQTLMISINKLKDEEKAIFLDIACFCIGEDKTYAEYMWYNINYSPHSAIDDLLLMSLIKIDENNKFRMHDEVRDLGRYIVKKHNFEDRGERTWVRIDVNTLDILRSNKEKQAVRALSLDISHELTPEELACVPQLIFLGGERMKLVGDFENLLHNLRWLSWHHCPPDLLVKNLHLVNLVVLDLSWSNITNDWGGWLQIKMATKLKVLDLTSCKDLTKTPDFSEFGKLEKLILAWCEKLSTIDSSIAKPFKFPETIGNLKSLMKFEIQGHSNINQLPHSIGSLTNLMHLRLRECQSLYKLPDSIGELESLVELDLESSGISVIPDSIGKLKRLKFLRVAHTQIHTLPCALGRVETLNFLDASFCQHLIDEIPWEMWSLPRLKILDLDGTPISSVPKKISGFSSLQMLQITSYRLCPLPNLPSSLKRLVVKAGEFPVLPDLSGLLHLDHLEVCRRHPIITFWSADEVISPWKDAQSIHQLPRGLSTLKLGWIPQLPDFSDFKSLLCLSVCGYPMPHLPVLEYSESLRELEISWCESLERTPDLSCLKRLQKLQLSDLPQLIEIPGLGEVESLKFLHITACHKINKLPKLLKLKKLKHLKLDGCGDMSAVEGLKEFNLLEKVEIEHCVSLKRLRDESASPNRRPRHKCCCSALCGLGIRVPTSTRPHGMALQLDGIVDHVSTVMGRRSKVTHPLVMRWTRTAVEGVAGEEQGDCFVGGGMDEDDGRKCCSWLGDTHRKGVMGKTQFERNPSFNTRGFCGNQRVSIPTRLVH
ncbi:disease resistance protein RPV1-like [Eucalyptus grandis]|uniref:disease resistance protein RPV1-like n=1 Tax=Eucalyptus grandis TaxID=71139 RepID=UPI00192EBF42|nr:disease resistance protein RPV1-like [Eucalyptus grandis]